VAGRAVDQVPQLEPEDRDVGSDARRVGFESQFEGHRTLGLEARGRHLDAEVERAERAEVVDVRRAERLGHRAERAQATAERDQHRRAADDGLRRDARRPEHRVVSLHIVVRVAGADVQGRAPQRDMAMANADTDNRVDPSG